MQKSFLCQRLHCFVNFCFIPEETGTRPQEFFRHFTRRQPAIAILQHHSLLQRDFYPTINGMAQSLSFHANEGHGDGSQPRIDATVACNDCGQRFNRPRFKIEPFWRPPGPFPDAGLMALFHRQILPSPQARKIQWCRSSHNSAECSSQRALHSASAGTIWKLRLAIFATGNPIRGAQRHGFVI